MREQLRDENEERKTSIFLVDNKRIQVIVEIFNFPEQYVECFHFM